MKNATYVKYYLAVLVLLMSSLHTLAQTPTVIKGAVHKMTKQSWYDIEPIGEDATGYYYLLHTALKQ